MLCKEKKRSAMGRPALLAAALIIIPGSPVVRAETGQATALNDYDTQDARLNAAFKALSQSLDDAGRQALRVEERQSIATRDATCKVPSGTVVKNDCTAGQNRARADVLARRAAGSPTVVGSWGYRTDCDFGHYVELKVTQLLPRAIGTWSDGTKNGGRQGPFKGVCHARSRGRG